MSKRHHWQLAKRIMHTGSMDKLLDMVDALVGDGFGAGLHPAAARAPHDTADARPHGCPWTRSKGVADALRYVRDESFEAEAEARALAVGGDACENTEGAIVPKLEDELGDVVFCSLLAVALATRDCGVEPENVYVVGIALAWFGFQHESPSVTHQRDSVHRYRSITEKLERRCPYMFAPDAPGTATLEESRRVWLATKNKERSSGDDHAAAPPDAGSVACGGDVEECKRSEVEQTAGKATTGEAHNSSDETGDTAGSVDHCTPPAGLPRHFLMMDWPWPSFVLSGEKSVETRGYALPADLVGREVALFESRYPDSHAGRFVDRLSPESRLVGRFVGTVVFGPSFRYDTREQWEEDGAKHLVTPDHPVFGWDDSVAKFGWPVLSMRRLPDATRFDADPSLRVHRSVFKLPPQPTA